MASKNHVTAGYFYITSCCQKAGNRVRKIPLGSNDVDHVIEFENGATLPYDAQAQSTHPDNPALIEFSYGGRPTSASWTAQKQRIGSGDIEKDTAKVHCITTSKGSARIQTPTVECRLDSSVPWQTDPNTKLLEIRLDVE